MHQPAIGFVCSQTASSTAILPVLDWAALVSKGTMPIISTFHSKLEQSVLEVLLAGSCPIIMVIGRKMYKTLPPKLQTAFNSGRLLIVSVSEANRISRQSATLCNQYILENAKEVVVGFASPNGSLEKLIETYNLKQKITRL